MNKCMFDGKIRVQPFLQEGRQKQLYEFRLSCSSPAVQSALISSDKPRVGVSGST